MKHLAVILVAASALVGVAHADSDAQNQSGGAPVALVKLATIEARQVGENLQAFGRVEQAPQHTASIAAPRESRVASVDVNAGESVQHGQVLLVLAPTPASSAAFVQAQSAETYARTELSHVRNLYQEHLATRNQVAQAEQQLSDAEADLKNAEQAGGAGQLRIRAPADGVVTAVGVNTGEQIAANTTLVSLALRGPLTVRLGVPPEQVTEVRAGMPVDLRDVYNPTVHCQARVGNVSAIVDEKSGLADVFVNLRNPVRGLMPGSYVEAAITLSDVRALAVPRSAVLRDGAQAYVFTVEGSIAHRVNVTTLADDGAWIAVKGDVKAGDEVVTLGNYELSDGMKIRRASH
jgi:RND family efflux transporter MFP subunit